MKKTHLFAHHSAASYQNWDNQFDLINDWHKAKKFPKSKLGFYVGYMYVIEDGGEIKRGRGEEEMGAHTVAAGKNYNRDGIGVCMAGNFTVQEPTEEQLRSWELLGSAIVERHNIPMENIMNHEDVKATSCAGYDFASHLKAYIRQQERWHYAPKFFTYEEQLKRTLKALARARGSRKRMLERKRDRLLKRIGA